MDMFDRLPSRGPVVLQNIDRSGPGHFFDGSGNPWQYPPDRRGVFIGEFINRRGGFFGDHQRVSFGQWPNIEERDDEIVLVNSVRGNFVSDDLGENGVTHSRIVDRSFQADPNHCI